MARVGRSRQTSEQAAYEAQLHLDGAAPLLDLDDEDGDLLSQDTSDDPMSATGFLQQNDPPKIRVVVRKRPLNQKERDLGEADVIEVDTTDASLVVHEPKQKVDLTKFVEMHQFCFDTAMNEDVTNDQVYSFTVQPLVATLFRGGKATCFAYGQTGSGKTFTMQPLPIRAAADMLMLLAHPQFASVALWVSCFEIYGGKLFDLLNSRARLETREDGKKRVCIVGLKEYNVEEVGEIQKLAEVANSTRSTGVTGANSDSSRSHSIMQFALKSTANPSQLVGKLSFIDLAGSERGADTYNNERVTRLEGAEINKSLLALKECIRALDSGQGHVPFRGSKLTEVLRDSFVGRQARTVMIANVSPNSNSCEHTLNTLRYADRVKELRKDKNLRMPGQGVTPGPIGAYGGAYKDVGAKFPTPPQAGLAPKAEGALLLAAQRASAAPTWRQPRQSNAGLSPRRLGVVSSDGSSAHPLKQQQQQPPQQQQRDRGRDRVRSADGRAPRRRTSMATEDIKAAPAPAKGKMNGWPAGAPSPGRPSQPPTVRQSQGGGAGDTSPRRSARSQATSAREGRSRARSVDGARLPSGRRTSRGGEALRNSHHPWNHDVAVALAPRPKEAQDTDLRALHENLMQRILEEEETLIQAHRQQIEANMALVREEMDLLGEVDKQGSVIDFYVDKLAALLEQKLRIMSNLSDRLKAFKAKLVEEEIMSRSIGSHHRK
ncbi:hypothetical protein WJX73_002260 [Symbiochloris irregularis]|uniref:Kinesin-like protein n=1 Tax=Symbiochloris irregularis TaxID=706552 RepID=A0AAW1PQA9_9CHLO